jgi:hypothetical protein
MVGTIMHPRISFVITIGPLAPYLRNPGIIAPA